MKLSEGLAALAEKAKGVESRVDEYTREEGPNATRSKQSGVRISQRPSRTGTAPLPRSTAA